MYRTFLSLLFAVLMLSGCGKESMMTSSDSDSEFEENTNTFRAGAFMTNANGKTTAGRAELVSIENGNLRMDFSNDFAVTPGPSLFIFLSNSESLSPDAINLGNLIRTDGTQMYPVPFGTTLDSFKYVLVYCVPFHVTFAFAELR
ncbi:MAG: DM13 domain-containing protein [Bacteroidetes bacterium]|nr:DM13 domain-containing protein [Bacteroidota bacterium]